MNVGVNSAFSGPFFDQKDIAKVPHNAKIRRMGRDLLHAAIGGPERDQVTKVTPVMKDDRRAVRIDWIAVILGLSNEVADAFVIVVSNTLGHATVHVDGRGEDHRPAWSKGPLHLGKTALRMVYVFKHIKMAMQIDAVCLEAHRFEVLAAIPVAFRTGGRFPPVLAADVLLAFGFQAMRHDPVAGR